MSISPFVLKKSGLDSDPKHCGAYSVQGLEATQKATFLHLLFKYIIKEAIKNTHCHNLCVYVLADYPNVQNTSGKHAYFDPYQV